jgi:MFS family permease
MVGFAPAFVLVLVALFAMGATDGLTMVAETGIMQRRTPDAVRSRAMAGVEAALSLGLAVAYLLAGPVLKHVGPQATYRIGGVSALAAAILLLPLLRLRHGSDPDAGAGDVEPVRAPDPMGQPMGQMVAGEAPRYASAEALEAATYPEPGRRSA